MVTCQNNYYKQYPYEANFQPYPPNIQPDPNHCQKYYCSPFPNPHHLQPELNPNTLNFRRIPEKPVQQQAPAPHLGDNYERNNTQFNYPSNHSRPTLHTAQPYNQNTNLPQFNTTYKTRPPHQIPHPYPAHPTPQPILNTCNDFNAMNLNNRSRIPQYPHQHQQGAPTLPQRSTPPKPILTNPTFHNEYSHISSINHLPDPNGLTSHDVMHDIMGEARTILVGSPSSNQLSLEDIPIWADVPVSQLPKKTFDFICHRLDSISYSERNWKELSSRLGYSLAILNRIKEAHAHTAVLLECWKPRLHELIHKLNDIDCKKLVSEILEDLKYTPPPVDSTSKFSLHPNYASSEPLPVYKPYRQNTMLQRSEYEPWTNVNPAVFSGSPPNPPSMSPSSSLSSPYTSYSSPSPSPTPVPGPGETEFNAEIFVSYDNQDKEIGQEIVRQVRQLNYTVACEDDVLAGGNELLERTQLFKKCRIVIGLISPDYIRDDFPYYEAIAGVCKSVTGMKRTFIPFHIRKTEDIPEFISNRRGIQWSDDNKWNKLKKSLVNVRV